VSTRSRRLLCALAAAATLAPAAPAAAQSPGGTEAPPPGSSGGTTVSAEGLVALTARSATLLRRVARFRGIVPAEHAGQTITVERFDEPTQLWVPIATAAVAPDGTYLARWRTDRGGRHRIRALLHRPDGASAATASGELQVTVHRPAIATWYGPGFYGRRTACGQRMTRSLLGVAHRRLRCGTPVSVMYRGRSITVPVVDRGPFANRARWDLTAATAKALGFEFTDRIGAVKVAPPRPAT
jgi:peptidoglycan lytic transglycosylase